MKKQNHCETQATDQNSNSKLKMAEGRHFENVYVTRYISELQ